VVGEEGGSSAENRVAFELAVELAKLRFFAENPDNTEVTGDQLGKFLKDIEDKYSIKIPKQYTTSGSADKRTIVRRHGDDNQRAGETKETGLTVTLIAPDGDIVRGQPVKFTATVEGGKGGAEFHFAKVGRVGDDAVDEIPVFSTPPTKENEFSSSFDEVGDNKVVVRAYDSSGATARSIATVNVKNREPTIAISGVPVAVHRGEVIYPTIDAKDPDNDDVALVVELPDDAKINDEKRLAFSVGRLGEHLFGIVAEDVYGGAARSNVLVQVTNRPPTIDFDPATLEAYPGKAIPLQFNAHDADGDKISTTVRYNGDTIPLGKNGQYLVAFHEPGEHLVEIEVSDNQGGVLSTNATVQVVNREPVILSDEGGVTVERGEEVALAKSISDPDGDSFSVKTVWEGRGMTHDAGKPPTMIFDKLGTHRVEIVAEDSRGGEARGEVEVTVTNAIPRVNLVTKGGDIYIGEDVDILADAADPDGGQLLYKFQIEGESKEPTGSPNFTLRPDKFGEIPVKVVVSDPDGGIATAEIDLKVTPRPPSVNVVAEGAAARSERRGGGKR
jgi:hypothetical protein